MHRTRTSPRALLSLALLPLAITSLPERQAAATYVMEYQSPANYTWAPAESYFTFDAGRMDMDGDGIPDIMVTNGPQAIVTFFFYRARDHSKIWEYNTSGGVWSLLGFFDIDGHNGKEALFTVNQNPGNYVIAVEWPSGTPIFNRQGTVKAVFDIDADGLDELLITSIASGQSRVEIFGDGNTVPTSVVERVPTPPPAGLAPNVPNPFNPQTRIDFQVQSAGSVGLRIYDAAGRAVRELLRDVRDAGDYSALWDGKDDQGRAAASGVYYYELQAGGFVSSRKMVLLR
jgi:hypothetical protein